MGTDLNTAVSSVMSSYQASGVKSAASAKDSSTSESTASEKETSTAAGYGEAAVYERSSESVQSQSGSAVKNDRSAIISQLNADAEARQNQLMDIVIQTMQGQGKALASSDDMWHFLADGDFTVDAATKAKAQADIAEDGYWGVEQTSDRILDFAKALSGNDPEKADQMLEAFKKGYEEATKTWGKNLPDITQSTYDAVLQKFDDWKNSASSSAAQTDAASEANVRQAQSFNTDTAIA